ncbi:MAG: hypothetical protein IH849_03970 [Acidobacteria bacterium]|nr:hypothetical protein [Acidobacteriota bacterium]
MKLRSALTWIAVCALAVAFLPTKASDAAQQWTAEKPGSDNITVVSHLPLGPRLSVSDIELDELGKEATKVDELRTMLSDPKISFRRLELDWGVVAHSYSFLRIDDRPSTASR